MSLMEPTETKPLTASVRSTALFGAFLRVGLSGFGGVLPFARRMLVEQQRWLTDTEFAEVLSLSQFLPGPNIVNVSVIIGRRFDGPLGAIAATSGLMLMPMVIVLILATAFAQFAQYEVVRGICNGISSAASGLILAMAIRLMRGVRDGAWQIGVGVIIFVCIGLLRLPLLWTLAVVAPAALGIAWLRR